MALSVQLREFPLPDNQPADTEMGYKAEPGFNNRIAALEAQEKNDAI